MLSLVFASFLLAATADPIFVDAGQTVRATVDVSPMIMNNAGTLTAEDPSIATIEGAVGSSASTTVATVTGIRPGTTRVIMTFAGGMSVWRLPVATIVVNEACWQPRLTLTTKTARAMDREAVALDAVAYGSAPLVIGWYEGETLLAVGERATLTLPAGTHHIVARAENRCGSASDEVEIMVVTQRRRATRH